jgi:hypothetical protein
MYVLIHFILIFIVLQIYDGHSNFLLNFSSSNDPDLVIMNVTLEVDFKLPVDDYFSQYGNIVSSLYFLILVAIC